MNPIVSVIIPTYKFAHLIGETLESVATQTFQDWECFVIDDESPDDTREVVQQFVKRDPRFRYVWQKNAERCEARNHGLRLARGEFVAFLDHDDLWRPGFLEDTVAYLHAHPEAGLVFTHGHHWNGTACLREIRTPEPDNDDLLEQIIRYGCPFTPTYALARRSAIEAVGGFGPDWVLAEDFELWTRLGRRFALHVLPRPLVLYRIHAGNAPSLGTGWLDVQQRLMQHLIADKTLEPRYRRAASEYLNKTRNLRATFRTARAQACLKNFLTPDAAMADARDMAAWIAQAWRERPQVVWQERWVLRALAKRLLGRARHGFPETLR